MKLGLQSQRRSILVGICVGVALIALLLGWSQRESISWGSLPDYTNLILVALAVVGLDSWRRQLRGTHDFELARRLLLAVHETRDALRAVRNPFLSPGEAGEHSSDDDWQGHAYQTRFEKVTTPFRDLRAAALEAEVVWGRDFKDELTALNRQAVRLQLAVSHLLSDQREPNRRSRFSDEDGKLVYEVDEDDDFNQELARIVGKFEDGVKPHLRR